MKKISFLLIVLAHFSSTKIVAQTMTDGIMMPKKNLCTGLIYNYDVWGKYWEGTLLRENKNIGTHTTQSVSWMAAYGITNKVTAIVGLPYVWTKNSAGTLSGQSGTQDFSAAVKYNPLNIKFLRTDFSVDALIGASVPATNYVADLQPMSIGMKCKTAFARAILCLHHENNFVITAQASYIYRQNILIDRTSYFTTRQVYSNEVAMPDMVFLSARAGYYSYRWAAEATIEQINCTSGHDIRRNDMPFPSNNMDQTRIGFLGHYRFSSLRDLQLVLSFSHVTSGRNVGQSNAFSIGLMKNFDFSGASSKPSAASKIL